MCMAAREPSTHLRGRLTVKRSLLLVIRRSINNYERRILFFSQLHYYYELSLRRTLQRFVQR
jgi:hypothetical protein